MDRNNNVLWNGTRKPFKDDFVWLLLLGLWMAGIFIASSTEGSGEHYYDLKMFIERKGAHIVEFFILTYLFWKVLSQNALSLGKRMAFVFIFSLAYAISDEFHQLFVFGREGKVSDIGIDCIGIFIFLIPIWFLGRKNNKKIPT